MYKRYYDEDEPFEVAEASVIKDLEGAYYHPEDRVQDIKDGYVIRTIAAAYAMTADQLTDEALAP